MVIKTKYRLGEYLIAEDKHGLLLWETHFNFGVQRNGKCYIFGNILVLGKCSHEGSGYLQLEFSELLQKLPIWDKTQYYCFISDLLNVSTGQCLTDDSLERHIVLTRSNDSRTLMDIRPGIFKLGRYQITVADNGEVSWQTYEGLTRLISGRCVIESNLLLIGPQENEERNQNKREFLDELNKLPKWDKTMVWCRSSVLRPCSINARKTENHNFASPDEFIMDEYSFDEEPSPLHLEKSYFTQYKEPSERLLQLNFKRLKTGWRRICGRKKWLKYLIALFLVGLLLGLIMIWHSAEKKSLFHHGNKQHHREHDD